MPSAYPLSITLYTPSFVLKTPTNYEILNKKDQSKTAIELLLQNISLLQLR